MPTWFAGTGLFLQVAASTELDPSGGERGNGITCRTSLLHMSSMVVHRVRQMTIDITQLDVQMSQVTERHL